LQRYAVTNTQLADFERMKALFMQRLVDRGYPVSILCKWFAAVSHSCRVELLACPPGRKRNASVPPVLVLPNGQFEMTAHIASVLRRVYAAYRHDPDVSSIFGGADPKLIVAYTKNRSLGAFDQGQGSHHHTATLTVTAVPQQAIWLAACVYRLF
jgi:hypothetical protein